MRLAALPVVLALGSVMAACGPASLAGDFLLINDCKGFASSAMQAEPRFSFEGTAYIEEPPRPGGADGVVPMIVRNANGPDHALLCEVSGRGFNRRISRVFWDGVRLPRGSHWNRSIHDWEDRAADRSHG